MKIDVLNTEGETKSQAELPESIFAAPIKTQTIHDVVIYQLAKRRLGTAATKNRSAVSGGGIKPWRQKGTGRARAGSIRSPLWVGGGTVFGPQPRSYAFKVNKKVKKSALKSALSLKAEKQELILLEDFNLEDGKTRSAQKILNGLGFVKGTKVLILVESGYEKLKQATRNIPGVKVLDLAGMNVYDLLWHQKLIITENSLSKLEELLTS